MSDLRFVGFPGRITYLPTTQIILQSQFEGCLVDSVLGDCDCLGQLCKDVHTDQVSCCPDMPKGKFLMFCL